MSTDRNRIDRVTTRTGDRGTTSLVGDERLAKHDPRIDALGSLDEANSAIGFARVALAPEDDQIAILLDVQSILFEIGATIATDSIPTTYPERLAQALASLESAAKAMNDELPPLAEFVLPGGNDRSARLHLARAVVRRAERDLWRFADATASDASVGGAYLNRLSDYLFIMARHRTDTDLGEPLWDRRAKDSADETPPEEPPDRS